MFTFGKSANQKESCHMRWYPTTTSWATILSQDRRHASSYTNCLVSNEINLALFQVLHRPSEFALISRNGYLKHSTSPISNSQTQIQVCKFVIITSRGQVSVSGDNIDATNPNGVDGLAVCARGFLCRSVRERETLQLCGKNY